MKTSCITVDTVGAAKIISRDIKKEEIELFEKISDMIHKYEMGSKKEISKGYLQLG